MRIESAVAVKLLKTPLLTAHGEQTASVQIEGAGVKMTRDNGSKSAEARPGLESTFLKEVLKRRLRAVGLTYREIAEAMNVSIVTVKRYFSTDRLTVSQLEQLCELAGIGLLELSELANAEKLKDCGRVKAEQEDALASDRVLALIRMLVSNGWTAAEILKEYDFDEATVVGNLVKLERLGFIDLLPGNIIRLRLTKDPKWRDGGPMRRLIGETIKADFCTMDFTRPQGPFEYQSAELSQASVSQIEQLMQHFVRTVRALRDADRNVAREHKRWMTVLIALRPQHWVVDLPDGRRLVPRSARLEPENVARSAAGASAALEPRRTQPGSRGYPVRRPSL